MGVCLNHSCIKNSSLDHKYLIDNVNQSINIDCIIHKNEKKSEINVYNTESDIKSLLHHKDIMEKDNNNTTNNYKIISCNIQSKYKTKFFNYSQNTIINNNRDPNNSNITNNEICQKLIYFTHLNDKTTNKGN